MKRSIRSILIANGDITIDGQDIVNSINRLKRRRGLVD